MSRFEAYWDTVYVPSESEKLDAAIKAIALDSWNESINGLVKYYLENPDVHMEKMDVRLLRLVNKLIQEYKNTYRLDKE